MKSGWNTPKGFALAEWPISEKMLEAASEASQSWKTWKGANRF